MWKKLLIVAVGAVCVAGCSGDEQAPDNEPPLTPTPSPEPEPEPTGFTFGNECTSSGDCGPDGSCVVFSAEDDAGICTGTCADRDDEDPNDTEGQEFCAAQQTANFGATPACVFRLAADGPVKCGAMCGSITEASGTVVEVGTCDEGVACNLGIFSGAANANLGLCA